MPTAAHNKVLLRGEETAGAVSIVENTMPAGAPGPPLHSHAFDESFSVLDGELTVQLDDQLTTARAGELVFAPRGVPHTLANLTESPARYLLVLTPPGFEREFARRAANAAGVNPPAWALQPIPEVTYLGPKIGPQQGRARVGGDRERSRCRRDKDNVRERVVRRVVGRANELRVAQDQPPILAHVTPHTLRRTYIRPGDPPT